MSQQTHPPAASSRRPPIVVVGAGPTGLLLAAELVRRDVDCLLFDAHDAPLGWDRASVMHARSIEVFEALGLADRVLSQGVKVRGARLRADGRTLGELNLGLAGGRYGFDLGLSEQIRIPDGNAANLSVVDRRISIVRSISSPARWRRPAPWCWGRNGPCRRDRARTAGRVQKKWERSSPANGRSLVRTRP